MSNRMSGRNRRNKNTAAYSTTQAAVHTGTHKLMRRGQADKFDRLTRPAHVSFACVYKKEKKRNG